MLSTLTALVSHHLPLQVARENTLEVPLSSWAERALSLNSVRNSSFYVQSPLSDTISSYPSAIQLAKISGFSPIFTTASSKHVEALTALGATHILDRSLTSAQVSAEVAKVTKEPINYVYDTISSESTQRLALDILAPGGSTNFVSYAMFTPEGGRKIAQVYAARSPYNMELYKTLYHDTIYGWLEEGLITVSFVPFGNHKLS